MSKRARVKGNGPNRRELKTFHKLGDVSPETVADLRAILRDYKHSDINQGDAYKITQTMDCRKTHGVDMEQYRQVILQTSPTQSLEFELDYDTWMTDKYCLANTMHDIGKHFHKTYRFRLSEMQPYSNIHWHIDTDTSVACRAQICLSDDDSEFFFKDNTGIHSLRMKPGELWFINTGWNHSVSARADVRQVAVFTFLFDDLINKGQLRL